MNKITLLLALTSLVFGVKTASAEGFKEPQQAIDAYITAISTGSGENIKNAYTEDATIKIYDREKRYFEYGRESFAEVLTTGKSSSAKTEITNLLVTGNVASATVEVTFGDDDEHGYVEYLNLINADGSWRVTSKVTQYVSRK